MERYFTLETESRRQFFQVPKQFMLKESKYYTMSSDSKLLYGILADRNSLSISNGWVDKNNRVYFIATVEGLIDLTGWAKQKVITKLKELRKFDLLVSERKGQGNPSWHYLLQVELEEGLTSQLYQQKYENHTSRSMKIIPQEVLKSYPNNNDNNKTNINNTDILSSSTEEVEEEDKNSEDLKTIMSFCNNVNFRIKTIEVERLLVTYSLDKIMKAINGAISSSKPIGNPYGYLAATLKDMEQPKNITIENKINTTTKSKLSSANFTQREYDYDKLEKQLLGWEDIKTEEETKEETIEEPVKQVSKKEQLCVELLNYMESKIGEVPFKTWILPYVKETKTQIIIDPDNNFTKGIIDKRYLGIIKEYATNTEKEIICN